MTLSGQSEKIIILFSYFEIKITISAEKKAILRTFCVWDIYFGSANLVFCLQKKSKT